MCRGVHSFSVLNTLISASLPLAQRVSRDQFDNPVFAMVCREVPAAVQVFLQSSSLHVLPSVSRNTAIVQQCTRLYAEVAGVRWLIMGVVGGILATTGVKTEIAARTAVKTVRGRGSEMRGRGSETHGGRGIVAESASLHAQLRHGPLTEAGTGAETGAEIEKGAVKSEIGVCTPLPSRTVPLFPACTTAFKVGH